MDIAGQETVPLEPGVLSATTFHAYLKQYDLDPLQVALAAGVRYLTVWNIQHGNPIRKSNALLVRQGLCKLTGVAYAAPIVTHGDGEEKKAYEAGTRTKPRRGN
jgi:hypothetical protein